MTHFWLFALILFVPCRCVPSLQGQLYVEKSGGQIKKKKKKMLWKAKTEPTLQEKRNLFGDRDRHRSWRHSLWSKCKQRLQHHTHSWNDWLLTHIKQLDVGKCLKRDAFLNEDQLRSPSINLWCKYHTVREEVAYKCLQIIWWKHPQLSDLNTSHKYNLLAI